MEEKALRTRLTNSAVGERLGALAFLAILSGVLVARFFLFISRYSSNLLFADQWAFYTPLFENQGIWQAFSFQYGTSREGLGLLVTAVLANLTGWNSRADAFAVGALMCLAMLLALILKYRMYGRLTFVDAIIPFLFLTLFQYEAIVVTPHLAYGAFPVLLIMLYCLGLCLETPWMRYASVLLLNFLLVYTGYGIFMGPITVILFGVDVWQRRRDRQPVMQSFIAFVVALASIIAFLISYRFEPAIPNFGFSAQYLVEYPLFAGLMLATFWGLHQAVFGAPAPLIAAVVLLATVIALLAYHGRRLARQGLWSDRRSLVITVLTAFSLLFCIGTAIGRMPLGLWQAQVSRYLTLLIPCYLGMYFHMLTIRPRLVRQLVISAFLAMPLVGSLPVGIVESQGLRWYEYKENWKTCYLQLEDIQTCNQRAGWPLYPWAAELAHKLNFLKTHGLNLYLHAGK